MKDSISELELLSEDDRVLSDSVGQLEKTTQTPSRKNITRKRRQGDGELGGHDSIRHSQGRRLSFSGSVDEESASSHGDVLFPWSDEADPSTWTMWHGIEENVKHVYTGKASRCVSPSPAPYVECLERPNDLLQPETIQPEWSRRSSLDWHQLCLLYVAFKRADVEHCECASVEDIRHTFFHDEIVQNIFSLHLSPEQHNTCYSKGATCPPTFVNVSWQEPDSLAESWGKKHKEAVSERTSLRMLTCMNDVLSYFLDGPVFQEPPSSHVAQRIQSLVPSGQLCRKAGGALKTHVMNWLQRWMDGNVPSRSITYESSPQKLQQMLQVLHQLKIRAIRCIDQRQTGCIKISFPKYAETFRPFLYKHGDMLCYPQADQKKNGNLLLTPQEKQNFFNSDFCNRLVRDGYLGTNFLSYGLHPHENSFMTHSYLIHDFPKRYKNLTVPKTLTMEALSDNCSLTTRRPTSPDEWSFTFLEEDTRDVVLDPIPYPTTGASKEKHHRVPNSFLNDTKELQDIRRCLASNRWDQFVRKSSLVSYPSLVHTKSRSSQLENW